MANDDVPVLAVYDFRSKQEFIYRTNRMREITGASELIAGMFEEFLSVRVNGLEIRNDWNQDSPQPFMSFTTGEGAPVAGEVVYEGGGNLLVVYRNRETFRQANRQFSRMLIEKAYALSMVCACVDWEPSRDANIRDFEWNRRRVYRQLDIEKRVGGNDIPCNALPYTQVDRMTFKPVIVKDDRVFGDLTQEGLVKRDAYDSLPKEERMQGRFIDDLASEKGEDSLIAILYFDGNSIGERVKSAVDDGVKMGKSEIDAIRAFSMGLHETLVEKTKEAMIAAIQNMPEEKQRGYRIVIDHGDEITLVCNAHAAPFALDAYFAALEGTGYHACGGMAICHAHDPYAQVYRIAEECCESGKKTNRRIQKDAVAGLQGDAAAQAAREADANYVDFHFCRSGIMGSLDQIRGAQEEGHTARPYRVDTTYATFLRVGEILAAGKLKRSDLKELNRAILRGTSWYALEYERMRSKDLETMQEVERACGAVAGTDPADARDSARTVLFDVTSLYDVFDERFAAGTGSNGNGGKEESDV